MVRRALALLLGLPALALGALGVAGWLRPDLDPIASAIRALVKAAEPLGRERIDALLGLLVGPIGGPALVVLGLALLVLAVRGGGASEPEVTATEGAAPDKRSARKASRQAASAARKGLVVEAAELCFHSGLLDEAARYYEQAGERVRAAEIRHDQNRFAEAAELYVQAGQHETAGTIYAAQNDHARAADCYVTAGRMSVAGEMYEKAGEHRKAGECYERCEFHRQAADAFEQADAWADAARCLSLVINEETARTGAGQDPGRQKALRVMVERAGTLFGRAGDLEAAEAVLTRGECWEAAAEIALRLERFDAAAELYQRAGDAPRAAEALRRIGEEESAAQILGEYHRDRGDQEEAARLLVQARDYAAAGDLYRLLEDYKMAGECYEQQGDAPQAGEMFRLAGDHGAALACFERMGQFEEAAECAAQLGDSAREAALLAQDGQLLRAAEIHLREGRQDEAMAALKEVPPGEDQRAASGLLGRLFAQRGKFDLAARKLRHAVGEDEVATGNVGLHYVLARSLEAQGELQEAVEAYERIETFDAAHRDVEGRLSTLRTQLRELPTGEPADPNRPPRYEIEGELGRGGMGIVYAARDTVLDRKVALKMLPDALRDNPEALKNFLREAKSAARLNHPNIVTVYDAGEQAGAFYIAMEYVDGTTLKEIVQRRGVVSPAGVFHVLLQMCEALDFAHQQKVVHRDVKTANTMWTKDRKAKIMDFGLAKVVEEVRNHTTLVSGTPYYMSPEQTLGKNVDHRTDLYSLGVSVFEMATGRLPFKEGNVPYHHVHTPPPNPLEVNPKLPKLLAQIIFKCMQKDPAARFQTAGEIAALARPALAKLGGAS